MKKNVFAHPTALVESSSIGEGTRIWAFAHVMKGASIGENCNIGDHCFVESGASVGRDVTVKNGVCIWEGVTIEDGVFVGPQAKFTNDFYPRSPRVEAAHGRYAEKGNWLQATRIKRNATLGAGSIILCGITVGEYAFIGAGAVATKDVPAHALVTGNPARQAGWACRCGQKLSPFKAKLVCKQCGLSYRLRGKILEFIS